MMLTTDATELETNQLVWWFGLAVM